MYLSLYLLALPLPLFGYEAAVITGFWLACLQLHSVKCHKVPFSICLFHATLHQPLTCGVHVVLEGGRFIQSKTSWKLALVFPFSSKDCVEGNFMTRRWIFISVFLGIWRSYHCWLKQVFFLICTFEIRFSFIAGFLFFLWIPSDPIYAIFIFDPLTAFQAGTIWRGKVHVHFWWIAHVFPYSIWIESLFEGQWFSSVRVLSSFWREEYLQSSVYIFHVLPGRAGWMTLDPGENESLSAFLWKLSGRKTSTFSYPSFCVKYSHLLIF